MAFQVVKYRSSGNLLNFTCNSAGFECVGSELGGNTKPKRCHLHGTGIGETANGGCPERKHRVLAIAFDRVDHTIGGREGRPDNRWPKGARGQSPMDPQRPT